MASQNEVSILLTANDQATKVIKGVKDQAGGLGKTLGDVGKIATGFLAATVIAGGAQKFVGFLGKSITAASDLGESINAVTQIFGESSDTILDWGKQNANAFGLSQRAFNQMATPMGAVLRNLGFAEEEVADQTIELTKRAADMASVFNTDVEDALAAINSALRGEGNPIERYGVSVNQTTVNLRALADTGKTSAAALTEQEKASARLALIFEQTASVAGDFSNTSDQLANSQRIAAARTEELQAKIGEKLVPVMLKITELKLALVNAIATKVIPALESLYATYWPGLVLVINEQVMPALTRIAEYLETNLLPAMIKVGNFVKDELGPRFVEGLSVIFTAFEGVQPLIEAFFNFIFDNEAALIISIAAVGAAIYFALGPVSQAFLAVTALIIVIGELKSLWEDFQKIAGDVEIKGQNVGRGGLGGLLENIPIVGDFYKASGGPVAAGQPYMVGERGPEMFVPSTSGSIVPNGAMGGMSIVVNVQGSVLSERDLLATIRDAYLRGGFQGVSA